jgi:hypothetical protein
MCGWDTYISIGCRPGGRYFRIAGSWGVNISDKLGGPTVNGSAVRILIVRPLARILLALCVLPSIATLGAQTSSAGAPLVLTIAITKESGLLHVVLKNASGARVHVCLGIADGSGHRSIDAVSLLFVDATGKTHQVVPVGIPIAGTVAELNEVIAPGKEWNTDIELKTFMVYDDPTNPYSVDELPAGSYTVYGIFKGVRCNWPPHSLPYWLGTIRSAPVQYALSK